VTAYGRPFHAALRVGDAGRRTVVVLALGGVALIALRGAGLKTQIPYGPYMLAGAWLGAVWGADVADVYLRASGLR